MNEQVDPREFGLSPRTVLERTNPQTIAIVMQRRSRIIMADGRKIAAKAAKIRQSHPGTDVVLKTPAPICGKTLKFLADEGIRVITDD